MATNTERLHKIQEIVDEINKKKEEVEILLKIIDGLEIEYYRLIEEIKNNK